LLKVCSYSEKFIRILSPPYPASAAV